MLAGTKRLGGLRPGRKRPRSLEHRGSGETMSAIELLIADSLSRLDKHIRETKPTHVFGLFSGGHDSFSATYVASLHPAFTAAVHINTGIGVPATREFVRETCAKRKWPLLEYKAWENRNSKGELDPQVYEELVAKYGFPGPGMHGGIYVRLKERCLRMLEREHNASCRCKVKRRVMFVSGCRLQESARRMGNTEELQFDGRRIWSAPILYWTKLDTSALLEHLGQERNPVVDLIHKSGECLCGAFAVEGELEELNLWDLTRPAYDEIKRLEKLYKEKHGWGWGEKPPAKKQKMCKSRPGQLCWDCQKQGTLPL